ncbi:MAG: hypothetical protein H6Q15_714 [Bacteroidetes bacterium]|nr:hypothetical protein [Bacteroidota bacterium]
MISLYKNKQRITNISLRRAYIAIFILLMISLLLSCKTMKENKRMENYTTFNSVKVVDKGFKDLLDSLLCYTKIEANRNSDLFYYKVNINKEKDTINLECIRLLYEPDDIVSYCDIFKKDDILYYNDVLFVIPKEMAKLGFVAIRKKKIKFYADSNLNKRKYYDIPRLVMTYKYSNHKFILINEKSDDSYSRLKKYLEISGGNRSN